MTLAHDAKIAILEALDLETAHRETLTSRAPTYAEHGIAFVPLDFFYDHVERVCPAIADRVRALAPGDVEKALAAWSAPRGAKPTGKRSPVKMEGVARLLRALGFPCKASTLAVDWSRHGQPGWRSDEWFRSWGTKRSASSNH